MTVPALSEEKKEGFIERHRRVAMEVREDPTTVVRMFRGWLVTLWLAKGGGFYGLGYVIAFLWLEFEAITSSFTGSSSVSGVVVQQAFELVTRICIQSIFNAFLALIWPLLLLQALGPWALLMLGVGYIAFLKTVRPWLESYFPELAEARARKAEEKQRRKSERNA